MLRTSSLIREDREYAGFFDTLKGQLMLPKPLPIVVNGLSRGASDAFLAEAVRDAQRTVDAPVLILAESEMAAARYTAWLTASGVRAMHYKSRDLIFHHITASHDTERERLLVLFSLLSGGAQAVVSTLSAALTLTMPRERLREASFGLSLGEEIAPAALVSRLLALGYVRVDMVESAGQFASRGGIVDLYPEASDFPIRIEFFGDEIDRMETFDPLTQRVNGRAESFTLLPAEEVVVDAAARARMESAIAALIKGTKDAECEQKLERERVATHEGMAIPFKDKYLSLIYPERETLLDYLGARGASVFVMGSAEVKAEHGKREKLISDEIASLVSQGLAKKDAALCIGSVQMLEEYLSSHLAVHINPFSGGVGTIRTSGLFGFRTRRTVAYGDNPRMLHEDVATLRQGGYRVLLLAQRREGVASLIDSLAEVDIPAISLLEHKDFPLASMRPGTVYVAEGALAEGFELITPRIAVLSMARDTTRAVLENKRHSRVLKKVGGAGERLMSYADLSVGDYVVHRHYGIGLFEGIESVKIDGVTRDYITIRYQGTDKLFVPCDRLEMIGKYIGQREKDGTVKLSRMGGGDWTKTKSRAKSAVRNIAKELIALYAERQRRPGFAFPEDSEMEREFAEGFGYEETDSQLAALEEIFADMKRPVPMNRLLCGDVGFGKTEVALRAAFKAIMGNKQVAILVPTTILALQHYQTALSRMRGYAINVEMLSRFRTPKEQATILRRLKRGDIDILIGTHKLLSKQLEFRDLGLLIVDEEQRFGVSQKEKLKQMSTNIDVLTLSATPIPRTLNMALGGINDMSVLDEAPGDRRPVQTYVLEHDDGIIYDAIRRELDREGQVLYLYNRVEDIDLVSGRLERAFPDARVTYAHGQMDREELEEIWQMLVRGELDILVCTTIIETGVDLPAANTLVIENADRMGLSQLHQIRGRVGRSVRQAYAYFTYRPGKALSEVATKRLAAIREFAEFGAGFKIALRDLEIRGAGNLLGTEQHGYIESVGYDLYVKLLAEAVIEEQGGEVKAPPECTVDVKVDAHIPDTYVPHDAQRMEMYKKISLITGFEDRADVLDEFLDRFGAPPRPTERLVDVATVRSVAAKYGITKVSERAGMLLLTLGTSDIELFGELMGVYPSLMLRATQPPTACARLARGKEVIECALELLCALDKLALEKEKKEKEKEGANEDA